MYREINVCNNFIDLNANNILLAHSFLVGVDKGFPSEMAVDERSERKREEKGFSPRPSMSTSSLSEIAN